MPTGRILNFKFQILNSLGFTLIELMVVVAIIGILSTIGYGTYSNIQGNARDAKRKADVDAIAKVLEDKYNPSTGLYPAYSEVTNRDFTSGAKPKQTDGTDYTPQFGSGRQVYKSFVICTTQLEKSTQPYCKYSANGSSASIDSLPSTTQCPKFNNGTGVPQACTYYPITRDALTTNITNESTVFIRCEDIQNSFQGVVCDTPALSDCNYITPHRIPWYRSRSDNTQAGVITLTQVDMNSCNGPWYKPITVMLK